MWCFLFLSTVYALPTTKSENDSEVQKPQPIFLEAIELPSEEKPTDNSKPSEMAVDPKPTDMKPTEQSKPSEPSAPTGTFLEPVSLNVGPPRRQFLYDQRQDGKYNIRAGKNLEIIPTYIDKNVTNQNIFAQIWRTL